MVSDRVSFAIMGVVCIGTIGAVFLTSAMRKAEKEQNRSLFQENIDKFRGK